MCCIFAAAVVMSSGAVSTLASETNQVAVIEDDLLETPGTYYVKATMNSLGFMDEDDGCLAPMIADTPLVTVREDEEGTLYYDVVYTFSAATIEAYSSYNEGKWNGQTIASMSYRPSSDVWDNTDAKIVYDNKLSGVRKFMCTYKDSLPDGLELQCVSSIEGMDEHPIVYAKFKADTIQKTADADLDTSEIKAIIENAKEVKTESYTSKSVAAFEAALKQANDTYEDMEATQEEVDEACKTLGEAYDALETVPVVTFAKGQCKFSDSMTVELADSDEDATIYYTTDGSEPSAESTQYTKAFEIDETTTVKAIAVDGDATSEVSSVTYTKRTAEQQPGTYQMKATMNRLLFLNNDSSDLAPIIGDTPQVTVREDEVGNTYYDVVYTVMPGTVTGDFASYNEGKWTGQDLTNLYYMESASNYDSLEAKIVYDNPLSGIRKFQCTYKDTLPTEKGLKLEFVTGFEECMAHPVSYAVFDTSTMKLSSEITTVDTTDLTNSISAAQAYYEEQEYGDLYSIEEQLKTNLTDAIANGQSVLEDMEATQSDIDAATQKILDAYNVLRAAVFDYDVQRITIDFWGAELSEPSEYYLNLARNYYASLSDDQKKLITAYHNLLVNEAWKALLDAQSAASTASSDYETAKSALAEAQTALDEANEGTDTDAIAAAQETYDAANVEASLKKAAKDVADALVAQRNAELSAAKAERKAAEAESETEKEKAEADAQAATDEAKVQEAEKAQAAAEQAALEERQAREAAEQAQKEADEQLARNSAAAQEKLEEAQRKLEEAQAAAKKAQAEAEAAKKAATQTATQTAVTSTTKSGVTYEITGNSAAVTKVSSSKKSVSVAATVKIGSKTYKVTTIKAKAFASKKKLKKVTIGKNVTTIEQKAFYKSTNLKKVIFKGTGVKTVGKKAFAKTNKKATFKLPKKKYKAYRNLIKNAGASQKAKYK
ncbi:MAG: chitobiase/beta-hexosaminidase C-terminal domain-containing protein [Eubacterium sp.]|nr:chitobiase/beta-hexosaminidase C-terminal domain-containing protein [Eubacterium sp.]